MNGGGGTKPWLLRQTRACSQRPQSFMWNCSPKLIDIKRLTQHQAGGGEEEGPEGRGNSEGLTERGGGGGGEEGGGTDGRGQGAARAFIAGRATDRETKWPGKGADNFLFAVDRRTVSGPRCMQAVISAPSCHRLCGAHAGYCTDKHPPLLVLHSVCAHVGYSTDRYPPLLRSMHVHVIVPTDTLRFFVPSVFKLDIVPTDTLRFFVPSVFKLDIVPTDTLPFCVPSVFTLDIEPTNTFRCFVLSMLTLDIVPTDTLRFSLRSVCTEIGTH